MGQGNDDGEFTGINPARRLISRARWIYRTIALFTVLTVLLDVALLTATLLRRGSVIGIQDGRIAIVLELNHAFPPIFEPADLTGFTAISALPMWQSLLAAMLLAFRLLPVLAILFSLLGLFGMYARGAVFVRRNTLLVRRIAWSLVAYAIVPLVNAVVFVATGMSRLNFELEFRQIDAIIVAVILFAVADVVSFGCAIDEDRDGFV